MKKDYIDSIIGYYLKSVFHFSLSKMSKIDDAEELAARIIFDVYTSLLRADEIKNIDGYVYKVCCNVYARFIEKEVRGRQILIRSTGAYPMNSSYDYKREKSFVELRREIAYLSKIHRDIVVLHYFEKLKLNEIAERLNIPLGTVKWHLHDAKNQLKEGMKMQKEKTLDTNPVRINFGYWGAGGSLGETPEDYLAKLISKNIVYTTYHKAKSISEIAKELNVSAAYIEDEVAHLVEYDFLEKTASNKYLANIILIDPTEEIMEKTHEVYKKHAKLICEKYVPLVVDFIEKMAKGTASLQSSPFPPLQNETDSQLRDKIYFPEGDLNFLKWCLITYACGKKIGNDNRYKQQLGFEVKRKDGSEYVAMGWVARKLNLSYNPQEYIFCGDLTSGVYPDSLNSKVSKENAPIFWENESIYDYRSFEKWRSFHEGLIYLYEYMAGKLEKTPENVDAFKMLFDKGYLVNKDDKDYVNMIVTNVPHDDFMAMLPEMPAELFPISKAFDKEIYDVGKKQHPARMHKLFEKTCYNSFSDNETRGHIVKQLIDSGVLQPLTEAQKTTLNMIMFL